MSDLAHSIGESDRPFALVTDGSSGVGECCAKALAKNGYSTLIVGRRMDQLRRVADLINFDFAEVAPCIVFQADLSNYEEMQKLLYFLETVKVPDVFVSAAGLTSSNTRSFDAAELGEVMSINAIAPIYLASRVSSMMAKAEKGYIINIASRAGIVGFADKGIYGASKAAAIRFFNALYASYLDSGLRVTSICPAWINTPMAAEGGCTKRPDEILQPDDISSVIVWLVTSNQRVRIREIVVEAGGTTAIAPP